MKFEYLIWKVRNNDEICNENKRAIIKFLESQRAELSLSRLTLYANWLPKLASILGKPFKKATEEDLRRLVSEIKESEKYSTETKYTIFRMLKKFYRWLEGKPQEDGKVIAPKKIAWLKANNKHFKDKQPEELLTPQEIFEMIRQAPTLRDKALILVGYESGARPHELLSLKVKHIAFDEYGVRLTIPNETKTGSRVIRLIDSTKILADYLSTHPEKDNPEAWLWISKYGSKIKRYTAASYRKMLKNVARLANIKKRVYPYLLRHTRATILAKFLTESQLCKYMGWVKGSEHAQRYIHLSMRDVEDAILRMHRIKRIEEDNGSIRIECSRCGAVNSISSSFCEKCGMPLQLKTVISKEEEEREKINEALKDLVEKKVRELLIRESRRRAYWDGKMTKFMKALLNLVNSQPNIPLKKAIEEIRKEVNLTPVN